MMIKGIADLIQYRDTGIISTSEKGNGTLLFSQNKLLALGVQFIKQISGKTRVDNYKRVSPLIFIRIHLINGNIKSIGRTMPVKSHHTHTTVDEVF
jgi:hypothetical protein